METAHGACVAIWDAAILIRGEAGAGKSTLAACLLDRALAAGLPCGLVADDRVRLEARDGAVIALPHPVLSGLLEIRGIGILRCAAVRESAPIRLLVDLVVAAPRLPDQAAAEAALLGIALPRLVLDRALLRAGLAPRLILDALASSHGVAARTHSPLFVTTERPDP